MHSEQLTYEMTEYGDCAVYAWGTYGTGSVLAGQPRKRFVDALESPEAVKAAYPSAVARSAEAEPHVSLSHLPGEDDPVAGGMYPDDWPE